MNSELRGQRNVDRVRKVRVTRVAGCLLLLYAQPITRLARLTLDCPGRRTGCTLTRAAAELIISYGAFLDRGEFSRYITAFTMIGDPVASSRTRWPRGRARTAVTSRFSAYARRGPALGPVSLGTGTIATAAPDSRISAPG
jgi:hypothetical protein